MKYTSARAFRQALEDRLRSDYPRHQIPRIRKMIAFERFMARLGEHWILKGGYALQLRTEKARTTQDIDLLAQCLSPDRIAETLLEEVHRDLGDYFEFFVERANQDVNLGGAVRFRVTSRLAGRVFERFHIDIGVGDLIVEPVEYLTPPAYLEFADFPPAQIPCYPVSQHLAEKLHALVRPRQIETSRVKDLVDILLFACLEGGLQAEKLCTAIQAVFEVCGDSIPAQLDQIPTNWRPKFNQFTRNLDLPFSDFDEAVLAAQRFINPILEGMCDGKWDPINWKWKRS
jgi:hypothetical protein